MQPELRKRRGAGEEQREASQLANSPGSAKNKSCGEPRALGALSPLFCVLVPPCPSPGPLSFPHRCFPPPLFSLVPLILKSRSKKLSKTRFGVLESRHSLLQRWMHGG